MFTNAPKNPSSSRIDPLTGNLSAGIDDGPVIFLSLKPRAICRLASRNRACRLGILRQPGLPCLLGLQRLLILLR
jgi:hypothetical protein